LKSPEEKIAEFARRLESYRDDPVGFCSYVLGMVPHPGQAKWLTDASKNENALVTGNRWGKSSIAAAKLIWKAVYRIGWSAATKAEMEAKHEPYHALNVSLTADQSRVVWDKALALLSGPKAAVLLSKVTLSPFPRLDLINGSIIEARSTAGNGHYLLGHVYDAVNWDEAAFEPHFRYIRDGVLRMRVVDRAGVIDYTSTGNGRNDFGQYFLDGLAGKEPNLYSQSGPTTDNPHIDQSMVSMNAARMTERMVRQNISGEIVDAGDSFFEYADVQNAIDNELTDQMSATFDSEDIQATAVLHDPFGDGPSWIKRFPSHRYIHAWDVADKRDWTVGCTIDVSLPPPWPVVEFERFQKLGWSHVYARARDRHARYAIGGPDHSTTYVDSTGVGEVVVQELRDIRAKGFMFTGPSKDELLANLQSMLNLREIRFPFIRPMVDELLFYTREDEDIQKDCVMSLAIAALAAKKHSRVLPASFGFLKNTAGPGPGWNRRL
jgi:hypothetical protein